MDKNKFLSESIFIILIPAYGFLISFAVESGYASFFGIPWMLIEIDGRNIAVVVGSIIIGFFLFFGLESWLASIFAPIIKNYKYQSRKFSQVRNFWFLVFSSMPLLSSLFFDIGEIRTIIISSSVCLLWIILIIVEHINRNKEPRVNAIEQVVKESDSIDDAHNISVSHSFFGKQIINLVFVTAIAISVANQYGQNVAKKQDKFYLINSNADYVGITIYSNKVICLKNDSGVFSKVIKIIEIKDGIEIERVNKERFYENAKTGES